MTIGPYTILSVEASRFALDGGAMFGIVPKTVWEKQIQADEKNRIPLCTRCLLLISDERKIMVDTGIGDKWDEKYRAIYKIDTETTGIQTSLAGFGLSTEDITDVLCTHLHFDHAGGNTCFDESGSLVPTFPKATYWVQRSNWALANAPSEKDRASYMPENWTVLAENGMIELVDEEEEFIPGIEVVVTNGHTSGQQLPKLSDGSRILFFAGDLFPTVSHLRIPWVMAYDNNPMQTIREKKSILSKMVEENWILFLEHDLAHEAITVDFDGRNYLQKDLIPLDGNVP